MMLDSKQQRMLGLLNREVSSCKKCKGLWKGGKSLPYWTPLTRYLIIGEAPGADEVDNEPFVGKAGKILWEAMGEYGFRKEQFGIINSTQCRPVTSKGTNGKPTLAECRNCYPWVRKFIKVIKPERIIALGNFAKQTVRQDGDIGGIIKFNGMSGDWSFDDFTTGVTFSVHPSMAIYKGEEGLNMLKRSLHMFSNLHNIIGDEMDADDWDEDEEW